MNRIYNGKYHFYLEYYTYVKITDLCVLLLNTLDNQKIISSNEKIIQLIKRILYKKNSVLEIDFDTFYVDDIYQLFFEEVRNKYMGDLIAINLSKGEPVNFFPTGKINNNFRVKDKNTFFEYNFLCDNFFNLNIYLNTTCAHNCPNCKDYHRLFICCSKFLGKSDNNSIEPSLIENMFKYSKFENLNRINILGGNISLYKNIDSVLYYLSDYKENCHAYFKYNNVQSINAKIVSFFDNRISIIVDVSEIDENDINILINDYNKYEIYIVLTDELQLEKIVQLTTSSISYKLIPFFNGKNLSFFKNNVFLSEEDILETKFTIKKIHKNQFINSLFYGNLIVLPDGNVCIDINGPILGNLYNETIFDIISKALLNGDSLWFKTRNTTSCSSCLFVDLCPPISNYELVIGQSNLCHIKL